jgi:hypothetical protein
MKHCSSSYVFLNQEVSAQTCNIYFIACVRAICPVCHNTQTLVGGLNYLLYVPPDFNVQRFCTVPTECISLFYQHLRTNGHYFCIEH